MCLGLVGRVTHVEADGGVQVRAGDRLVPASVLALPGGVEPGEWVVMHSGFALARITEEEAREALALRSSATEGDS